MQLTNAPRLFEVGTDPESSGDEWFTPRWLFDAIGIRFDLDVCAPVDRTFVTTPADRFFTVYDDGLAQPWSGVVWCNPPYSGTAAWSERMIAHGDGLLLTHVPINAAWVLDVWDNCSAISLFSGMYFVKPDGSSQRLSYALQLAAFGQEATTALTTIHDRLPPTLERRWAPGPVWENRLAFRACST